MMPSKIIFLLQATLFIFMVACSHSITPPPLTNLPLRQQFRDWRSIHVCEADQKLVETELTRFNTFADTFLEDTSGKTKLSENQQIALLKLSPQVKPLLDGFGNLIFQSPSCAFAKNARIMSLVRRASGLLSQSRQRLEQAPELLWILEEGKAIDEWKKQQPSIIAKARKEWCPTPEQRSPAPDIFYVSEDENLRKEWLFCDDTKMVAEPGKEISLILPKNPPRNHRSYPRKLYFEAAESYPDSQIQRPPKMNSEEKEKTP